MRHTRHAVLALVAVALMMAAWSVGSVQGQNANRPTRVGVADVEMIFNALEQKSSIEAELQGRNERLQQQAAERRGEIEQLQEDLGILAPGSDAFLQKQQELEQKTIELQAWMQWQGSRIQQERALQIGNLYRHVLDATGRVAKQHNVDVVLFKEKEANFSGVNPDQISTMIQVRKVLWSADELDLTERVIHLMNNEWRNMMGQQR